MKREKKFVNFEHNNGTFIAREKTIKSDRLPFGIYELDLNQMTHDVLFKQISTEHDKLIDLPSDAYSRVLSEIETFLKDETAANFEKYGFIYKRSSLLYGIPGSGKTCIVNRVAQKVIEKNGIVLFNPHPAILELALPILEDIQKESKILVIFEELDQLIQRHESRLLNLLDGEIQKSNMIYLATTNFINQIPPRICRPGRFSSMVEVSMPSESARICYLKTKLPNISDEELSDWVRKTEGFSIDDLKETVLAVKCLNQKLDDVIIKISLLENKKGIKCRAQYGLGDAPDSDLNKLQRFVTSFPEGAMLEKAELDESELFDDDYNDDDDDDSCGGLN